jgi:Ca2+-binding RTX toxin-like protein
MSARVPYATKGGVRRTISICAAIVAVTLVPLAGGADQGTAGGRLGRVRDYIHGYAGDDELIGSAGRDYVWGGAGDDRVTGNGGRDRAWGGPVNDTVLGGDGADVWVAGGSGDDTVTGGTSDRLFGDAATTSAAGGND